VSAELFEAIKKSDRAGVERLVEADPKLAAAREPGGVSAVLTALYHREFAICELLVARRPDLDVFEAAATGDGDRLRALVDGDPSLANALASDGFHPLGLAAFFKRPEAVTVLLERGADPAPASRNQLAVTALHSAVATDAGARDIGIVRELLDAGAPINARSGAGGTPLHTAAYTGDREVVELLLARGADARVANNDGKSPIDLARERGHAKLAEVMERPSPRA
jgi:ankyrin repeat protein